MKWKTVMFSSLRHASYAPGRALKTRRVGVLLGAMLMSACSQMQMPPVAAKTATVKSPAMAQVARDVIQGDMVSVLNTLRDIPESGLPAPEAAMRRCVLARFDANVADTPAPGLPPAANAIIDSYRRYWRSIMLRQAAANAAEARLLADLNGILVSDRAASYDRSSLGEATDAVVPFLDRLGLHALTGVTSPFYELMLWRSETLNKYEVALPERPVSVSVVFMRDFIVKGWLSYATCDRSGAGGWATKDKLFAVAESYDLDSEQFKVSYLVHEGQHFADYQDFPELQSPELEYRAKLAELVKSTTTHELFARFANGGTRGRAVPHAHAQYWLGLRLAEQGIVAGANTGLTASDEAIRTAATRLLQENSRELRAAGAAKVEKVLAD